MGRTFISFKEAAELLRCSERTVHNYVRRQLLRKKVELGKIVLLREEVEKLNEDLGEGLPPLTNSTLRELLSRLSNVEMQLAVFKKIHGIQEISWLRPTEIEGRNLCSAILPFLEKDSYEKHELEMWASIFQRLDEVSFRLLKKATNSDHFWKDFFSLCIRMLDFVSNPEKNKKITERAKIDLELSLGLKNLRAIVMLWIESGHGKTTTQLIKNLGSGRDDLIRRLVSS